MSFPATFRAGDTGLDPGWVYAVNVLSRLGHRFGRDVVFTSGPLGFLKLTLDIGDNLYLGIAFKLLVHLGFIALLVYHARRQPSALRILLFVAAFAAAVSRAMLFEYEVLIVLGLLLLVDRVNHTLIISSSAVFAALLLPSKFTAGVAALGMVIVAASARVVRRDIPWRRGLAAAALPYLGTVLVLGAGLLGGAQYLPRFLKGSFEISSGYAVAMSRSGPMSQAVYGLVATGAALAALAWHRRKWPSGMPVLAVFLPVIAVAFRHAYVRHGGRWVFPVLMAVLGIAVLRSHRWIQTAALTLACAIVAAGASLAGPPYENPAGRPRWGLATLSGNLGWSNLTKTLDFSGSRAAVAQQTSENLRRARLPVEWTRAIRAGGSVDVVPFDLGIIAANPIPWSPNPVLQTYSAYTPYLDAWSARHYTGAGAPAFVIVEYVDIDGRHPMMGAPATWRAILRSYEIADARGKLVLLRKAVGRPVSPSRMFARTRTRIGSWHDVPKVEGPLFARLEFRLSPAGLMAQAAWRILRVDLELRYEDGTTRRWRIVPSTASAGLLLNYPPSTQAELIRFQRGRLPRRVLQFRITGPGARYYEGDITTQWERGL